MQQLAWRYLAPLNAATDEDTLPEWLCTLAEEAGSDNAATNGPTAASHDELAAAASEPTAVAIEQNEIEANGVDHETSSDAESEHAAELPVPTKDPVDEDREMDIKKEDLLKVSF